VLIYARSGCEERARKFSTLSKRTMLAGLNIGWPTRKSIPGKVARLIICEEINSAYSVVSLYFPFIAGNLLLRVVLCF
jgi:hypothetical protein